MFDLSFQDLIELNPETDFSSLKIGQVLVISKEPTQPPQTTPVRRATQSNQGIETTEGEQGATAQRGTPSDFEWLTCIRPARLSSN